MFSFMVDDVNLLKRVIDSLHILVDEVSLKITDESVSTRCMDLSKVALVELYMPREMFVKYECDKEHIVGLNILDLKSRVKRASANDELTISYNDELKMMEIIIQGASKRIFRFRTLTTVEGYLERVPKVQFTAKAKLLSETFTNMVLDSEIVSEELILKATEKKFIAEAKGESGETIVELEKESEGLLELNVQEEATSRYKIDMLKNMVKGAKISETVDVYISNNLPLKIEYVIPGGGKLAYYLAPITA